jgi:hypothetical protein
MGCATVAPVPLPTVSSLAFLTGILSALAGRSEIKLSPRHPLLTRAFGAFAIFTVCVMIPVSVYFYVFHGDWFLLYLVDVRHVPSALALVGFVLEAALGAGGFALGASLLRSQREAVAGGIAGLALLVAIGVPLVLRDRLSRVGSFSQFSGGFGLVDYSAGPIFTGSLVMGAILATGVAFLLGRLWVGERR